MKHLIKTILLVVASLLTACYIPSCASNDEAIWAQEKANFFGDSQPTSPPSNPFLPLFNADSRVKELEQRIKELENNQSVVE